MVHKRKITMKSGGQVHSQKHSSMEPENDLKENLADLTKIPPKEFEKHFQDWMERDDVARSLQAKLRSDLIKNFNKTNLGKHLFEFEYKQESFVYVIVSV